jgi:hypothetical protein
VKRYIAELLATFDQQLWEAAKRVGLKPWPDHPANAPNAPEQPPDQSEM